MSNIINILYLEDDPLDVALVKKTMKKANLFEFELTPISTQKEFEEKLNALTFDIVISDYSLPSFNGRKALELLKSIDSSIPFILVSGAVGDELAVDIMKAGAVDYVLKENLDKLPLIIARTLELTTAQKDKALWEDMFHLIESASSACFFRLNGEGRFVYANKQLCELIGVSKEDMLQSSWHYYIHPDMKDSMINQWNKAAQNNKKFESVCKIAKKEGGVLYVNVLIIPEKGKVKASCAYVGMFFDVTGIKETEEKLEKLENFDPLTRLINRSMFESILDDTIKNAKQFEKKFSLLFFDVHGIKKINDALGHEIGDKFLVYAASVFRDCCGEDDIAARFEGNIFIMLVNHDNQTSRILDTINKVIGVFNNSHLIDDEKIYCKISIGVANYPESGTSRLSLLIHADQALYKAKENYYTSYAFYSDKIGEEVDRFSRIESNLRQAIKSDEIYLCYQPQISLKDNKIIGLEALCRWKSEALGEISPIDFIPIAESVQLINQLTKKICEQAFRQCSEWVLEHPALFDNTEISINLSAVSLSDTDFMESILTMYADYNLEPKNICFEVTETAIMSNKEAAYHALKKISDMGFNIAIDDFGTGHSSLAYLKSLPATILKVDSSFVLDIHRDNNDLMIVSAIINLAKSLGLYVIAEGMENKEQLEILRNLEADAIQGYYFSKPILAKDVVSFFSKWGKL